MENIHLTKKQSLQIIFVSVILLIGGIGQVFAQNITTAAKFFQSVSEYYGTIKDYEATMNITAGRSQMAGQVSFKRPNLLRIDFTNPKEQVILFNGDTLTIHLPGISSNLKQSVSPSTDQAGMNLATPQGLALMSRYYSVAYEVGQDPVPLSESNPEQVIKLVLYPRNSSEGFRRIKLAVVPETKLIRQVEALTTQGQTFVFYFYNYNLNQNIPDQRFVYDAPSDANNFNNFLFSE